jgi:hypothetical protein
MPSKKQEWTFNKERAWVTWVVIGFGISVYALFVPDQTTPIGLVWGETYRTEKKSIFHNHGSFVQPWARRQGVRTKLNEEILKQFDVIETGQGSKEGGLAFLKASGYKQSKVTGAWQLTRKKK